MHPLICVGRQFLGLAGFGYGFCHISSMTGMLKRFKLSGFQSSPLPNVGGSWDDELSRPNYAAGAALARDKRQ
jgi:hypothetical protein